MSQIRLYMLQLVQVFLAAYAMCSGLRGRPHVFLRYCMFVFLCKPLQEGQWLLAAAGDPAMRLYVDEGQHIHVGVHEYLGVVGGVYRSEGIALVHEELGQLDVILVGSAKVVEQDVVAHAPLRVAMRRHGLGPSIRLVHCMVCLLSFSPDTQAKRKKWLKF